MFIYTFLYMYYYKHEYCTNPVHNSRYVSTFKKPTPKVQHKYTNCVLFRSGYISILIEILL